MDQTCDRPNFNDDDDKFHLLVLYHHDFVVCDYTANTHTQLNVHIVQVHIQNSSVHLKRSG